MRKKEKDTVIIIIKLLLLLYEHAVIIGYKNNVTSEGEQHGEMAASRQKRPAPPSLSLASLFFCLSMINDQIIAFLKVSNFAAAHE